MSKHWSESLKCCNLLNKLYSNIQNDAITHTKHFFSSVIDDRQKHILLTKYVHLGMKC